ncbi:MAG: glycosyl hydrolase family 79 C-terminal domain-containing protein [Vulcanimicrobiota bacterium]
MRLLLLTLLLSGLALAEPLTLKVSPEAGRQLPEAFLGLSLEKESLASGKLDGDHQALVKLLRLLGPGTLRLGGNAVDQIKLGSGYSESDIKALFTLARAADWKVIYGLNLGANDAPAAATEARLAWRLGSDRILAFEIGNEPDLFAVHKLRPLNWDVEAFMDQFRTYRAGLEGLPVSGPGAGVIFESVAWTLPFLEQEAAGLTFASLHFYPTVAKTELPADSPVLPSAENLLSPEITDYIAEHFFRPQFEAARQHGLAMRVTEANTTARSGQPGVSDAFVSALWVTDWTLRLLELGADGINIQTDLLNANDVYTAMLEQEGRLTARPIYYGMLLLAQLKPGRFAPVTLADPYVSGYAIVGGDLQLVLINRHEDQTVTIALPASGQALRLSAPSLHATEGVTLGGAAVVDGHWQPVYEPVSEVLTLPSASAVLLRLPR